MARIEYFDPEQASDRTNDMVQKNRSMNIFKMLAHSESHLVNYCRLGAAIRHRGELDPCLRELAITRTGVLCEAEYEVVAHKRIGREVGLSEDKINAIEQGSTAPVYSALESQVLAFTDDVVLNARPSDETFKPVRDALSPGALVELHLAIGYYVMTSKFLRSFDIDLEV